MVRLFRFRSYWTLSQQDVREVVNRGVDNDSSNKVELTIALTANSRIALIALGARFLKLTPCT